MNKSSFSNGIVRVFLVLIAPAMFLVTSCTKQTSPAADNAKFLGTWVGSEMCYYSNSPDTTTAPFTEYIGVGSDGSSLNIGIDVGANACQASSYITATVKSYQFSFAAQTFTDKCGYTYTTAGIGSLNTSGNTLTVTSYLKTNTTTTCTFTGTRQ